MVASSVLGSAEIFVKSQAEIVGQGLSIQIFDFHCDRRRILVGFRGKSNSQILKTAGPPRWFLFSDVVSRVLF